MGLLDVANPLGLIDSGIGLVRDVLDKIFPDPAQRAQAEQALQEAQRRGDLDELKARLSAILAEAQSPDPWTSRARPSFLYVIYFMILAAVPMGVVFAFAPEAAGRVAEGLRLWLAAIPKSLWTLFGVGYLGYAGGRTFEKIKGVAR